EDAAQANPDPAWLVIRLDYDENAPRLLMTPSLVAGDTSSPLRVGWQYLLAPGDHTSMPLPAKFGGAPDNFVAR
ncbi:MAG: hypothetical protein RLZZ303_3140, partial [Candidatus Hydrogenedentota bacterium]